MVRTIRAIALAIVALMALMWLPAAMARQSGGSTPLVCIDPGHGGEDPGAWHNDLMEKDANLEIALRTKPLVEAMGYRVLMTRTTDQTVSLQERCDIANSARADIFVSIHNNAYLTTSEGTETFCYYSSVDGRRLATAINHEVVSRIGLPDRGVKEAGFYVLKNTDMTAALVEGAFVSNPEEAELLKKPWFLQKIAEGVAEGIGGYLLDPGRFDTYIQLMNPGKEETAELELEFMRGDGRRETYEEEVPPGRRVTVHVDDLVRNSDVSTVVRSTNGVPIVAERSMYFDFEKGSGGHNAPGVLCPSRSWYLAEASTDWGYSTFILVQNPDDSVNRVNLRFMRSDGYNNGVTFRLDPHSRFTLDASNLPGFEEADFSVEVASDEPVVCERAMYYSHENGDSGGHNSPGVDAPSRRWYLAEGYTGEGFDTFVLIANPNGEEASVRVEYMKDDGSCLVNNHRLLPYSRKTIHLNEVPGLECSDVAARVDASLPVAVERSMYFDYNGVVEGSNSTAALSMSERWYLAEGYTGEGFDTYILLLNPGDVEATASLTFMLPLEDEKKLWVSVPARTRRTVKVNDIKGMSGQEFSTQVTSRQPLVVERAMYFSLGSKAGGHSAIGVNAPATEWYFAEGCTR
jgi:N-acetylmuramoyl-L-alanine amidase